MFKFFKIRLSARRMGLRDKGWTELNPDTSPQTSIRHPGCNTRLRVGIYDNEQQSISYCWRCEQICENTSKDKKEIKVPRHTVPSNKIGLAVDGKKILAFARPNKSP